MDIKGEMTKRAAAARRKHLRELKARRTPDELNKLLLQQLDRLRKELADSED